MKFIAMDIQPLKKVAVFFLMMATSLIAHGGIGGESGFFTTNPDAVLMREHTVRILKRNATGKFETSCSGFIQNSGEVITAGHCLKGLDNVPMVVEIYDKKAKKYQRFSVLKRAYISEFSNQKVDMGLVTFLPDSTMGLPNKSLPIAFGGCDKNSKYYTAGFGLNQYGVAGELRVNEYELAKPIEEESVKHEVFLKAKNGHACFGDSGGPVFCKVKGRLALLAVSSNVYLPTTLKHIKQTPEFCRSMPYLRASDVDGVQDTLQKFRDEEINNPGPAIQ